MGGKLDKKWYREIQIFEVRQAHPRMILVKVIPTYDFGESNPSRFYY